MIAIALVVVIDVLLVAAVVVLSFPLNLRNVDVPGTVAFVTAVRVFLVAAVLTAIQLVAASIVIRRSLRAGQSQYVWLGGLSIVLAIGAVIWCGR